MHAAARSPRPGHATAIDFLLLSARFETIIAAKEIASKRMEVARRYRTFAPLISSSASATASVIASCNGSARPASRAAVNASSPSVSRILADVILMRGRNETRQALSVPRQSVQCPDQAHDRRKFAATTPEPDQSVEVVDHTDREVPLPAEDETLTVMSRPRLPSHPAPRPAHP